MGLEEGGGESISISVLFEAGGGVEGAIVGEGGVGKREEGRLKVGGVRRAMEMVRFWGWLVGG